MNVHISPCFAMMQHTAVPNDNRELRSLDPSPCSTLHTHRPALERCESSRLAFFHPTTRDSCSARLNDNPGKRSSVSHPQVLNRTRPIEDDQPNLRVDLGLHRVCRWKPITHTWSPHPDIMVMFRGQSLEWTSHWTGKTRCHPEGPR